MGQALQEEGKLDDALAWYQQALELEPELGPHPLQPGQRPGEQDSHEEASCRYETRCGSIRTMPRLTTAWAGSGTSRAASSEAQGITARPCG